MEHFIIPKYLTLIKVMWMNLINNLYRQSEVRPFKARISLNAAFDIWKLRMALGVGNDLSLIRTGDEFQIAWGGIPRESIIDTPLFLRFETSFNQSPLKVGFVLNLATPWIISKNNFPDVFKAYGDKDLFLHYMKSSSIALIVQWSPTF